MIKPTLLVILDGWGENPTKEGNAIAQANTPNMDRISRYYPLTFLQASGISVGLPWGEMGNSEVGHLTLGAGRIIYQSLPRITLSIQNGSFFQNQAFLNAANHAKKNGGAVHLMGLASSGGVHSALEHLYALIELMKSNSVEKLFIHLFTDGRDSPVKQGLNIIREIEERLREYGIGRIASICGRYYAMDRNDKWDRTARAYDMLTLGEGQRDKDAANALQKSYQSNITDEFIEPTVIEDDNGQISTINNNDALIFFNYREDRARQLTKMFVLPTFVKTERKKTVSNLEFVMMTKYEEGVPGLIAFPPEVLQKCLGEIVSSAGLSQLRIAETEKYAHVTFFFNGGREEPFPNEDRILIPSPQVPTYDKAPEMSAQSITEKVIQEISKGKYSFILINFANADMVGHTGNLEATTMAVETLDDCLGKLIPRVLEMDGQLFITADHGNAEEVINLRTDEMDTEHSTFPVPFWHVSSSNQKQKAESNILASRNNVAGLLSDVAPTVLSSMGLEVPSEMSGQNLLNVMN